MGFRIHRDVNEGVKVVARFVQLAFPFRRPTSDVNRIGREVLHKGDVGMHVRSQIGGQKVGMRWSSCWTCLLERALEGVRRSRYFCPGCRGWFSDRQWSQSLMLAIYNVISGMTDLVDSIGGCECEEGAQSTGGVSFIMGFMVPSRPRIVLERNSWQG